MPYWCSWATVERTQQMLLSGPMRMVDLKVRMSCRDGTYRWIRWNSRSSARAKRDDDGTAERIRGITIDVTDRPGVRTVGYLGRVRGAGGVGSTGSAPEPHSHVLARELLHAPQNPPIPVRVTPEARNRRAGWAPVFSARRDEAVVPRIGHGRRYGETTVWQCTAAWSSGLGLAGGAWCVCVVGSGGPDRPDRIAGGRRAQARRGADEPGGSDDRGR